VNRNEEATGVTRHDRQRRRRRPKGAAIVEAALVLPLVLLVFIGVAEYARYVATRQVVENAVREGARYAVVRTIDESTLDAQIQDEVDRRLAGFGSQLAGYDKRTSIQVYKADPTTGANVGSWKDAGFGELIAVRLVGTFRPAVAGVALPLNGRTVPLVGGVGVVAESIMYSEAN
jgi:Flp pilus assembly protein TadG